MEICCPFSWRAAFVLHVSASCPAPLHPARVHPHTHTNPPALHVHHIERSCCIIGVIVDLTWCSFCCLGVVAGPLRPLSGIRVPADSRPHSGWSPLASRDGLPPCARCDRTHLQTRHPSAPCPASLRLGLACQPGKMT